MDLESHYKKLFKQHGDSAEAVQYADRKTQEMRFQILSEIADLCNTHVMDYGCGTGHLATFLKAKNIPVRYTGVDIVQEMLDCAQKKHPEHQFIKPSQMGDLKVDYAFIAGVLNNKIDDNRAFYRKIIHECFDRVRKGLAFNMMSSYVDYYDSDLFYEKPETIFHFIKTEVSPFVVLRNEYQIKEGIIPFEFTVYVYRK